MTRKANKGPSETKTFEGYRNDVIMHEKHAALKEEQ